MGLTGLAAFVAGVGVVEVVPDASGTKDFSTGAASEASLVAFV
jgi:hypothetical protein